MEWSTKKVAVVSAALLVALSSCAKHPAASEVERTTAIAHAWKVFDGDEVILDVSDTPGPILSTAALPPGATPARHPFLSASARSARHEHKLREHLNAAKNLPEFLGLLRAAGYMVVPDHSNRKHVPPSATGTALAMPSAAATVVSSVDASPDALGFVTAENIEMVPYCLPYPSAYLKEDLSERWEHGRKVFTARATPKGGRASRMDLAGTCGTRSLKELYEADRKDIETQVPPAAITVSRLDRGSYALSWRIGDRIHYGKMWTARADAGCFVRATFEYDVRERATFDAIIARVTASDPACSATVGPAAAPSGQ